MEECYYLEDELRFDLNYDPHLKPQDSFSINKFE